MGLRAIAENDLKLILEDAQYGFGWPITVTNPLEVVAELVGFSDDIAQIIDPDTGQAVSGRLASVVLRLSTLEQVGIGIPQGIADLGSKPWIVRFDDINGNAFTFKVSQSNPDRALGVVVCLLELYR